MHLVQLRSDLEANLYNYAPGLGQSNSGPKNHISEGVYGKKLGCLSIALAPQGLGWTCIILTKHLYRIHWLQKAGRIFH